MGMHAWLLTATCTTVYTEDLSGSLAAICEHIRTGLNLPFKCRAVHLAWSDSCDSQSQLDIQHVPSSMTGLTTCHCSSNLMLLDRHWPKWRTWSSAPAARPPAWRTRTTWPSAPSASSSSAACARTPGTLAARCSLPCGSFFYAIPSDTGLLMLCPACWLHNAARQVVLRRPPELQWPARIGMNGFLELMQLVLGPLDCFQSAALPCAAQ